MFIQFMINIILGWIIGSIGIIVLTILRFGIPLCNFLIKNKEEDEMAVKMLRKIYFISLTFWTPIIICTTFLCYTFLNDGFSGYIIAIVFMLLIGFSSTGPTQNNMMDFYNGLQNQKRKLNTTNKDGILF